jgi:hypothetical protein
LANHCCQNNLANKGRTAKLFFHGILRSEQDCEGKRYGQQD